MEELLQFPERYRVSLSISRETLFRKAILGPRQYEALDLALEQLRLLYTFPYRDGEVVVLLAEINDTVQERYFLAEFTNAIQCAIPYPMLLIVKCEYVVKFYFRDEEETVLDREQVASLHVTCTKDIKLNAQKDGDRAFFGRLRGDLEKARSATHLCERWTKTVSNYTDGDQVCDHEKEFFQESLVQSRALQRRKQFLGYTLECGQRFFYNETDEIRLYPGRALDEHGDWEHRLFLDYCCSHARSLYRQAEGPAAPEEQWLQSYLIACSHYAKSLYCRTLSNRAAREIIAAFYAEEEPAPDDDLPDYYSEIYLKDLMGAPCYSNPLYGAPLYSAPPKPEDRPQTEDDS